MDRIAVDYGVTIRSLRELGHDVIPVADIGLAQGGDEELLKTAQALGRIFVTRDRDFGNLVFVKALGAGVIYLRIAPSTQHRQSAQDKKPAGRSRARFDGFFVCYYYGW